MSRGRHEASAPLAANGKLSPTRRLCPIRTPLDAVRTNGDVRILTVVPFIGRVCPRFGDVPLPAVRSSIARTRINPGGAAWSESGRHCRRRSMRSLPKLLRSARCDPGGTRPARSHYRLHGLHHRSVEGGARGRFNTLTRSGVTVDRNTNGHRQGGARGRRSLDARQVASVIEGTDRLVSVNRPAGAGKTNHAAGREPCPRPTGSPDVRGGADEKAASGRDARSARKPPTCTRCSPTTAGDGAATRTAPKFTRLQPGEADVRTAT